MKVVYSYINFKVQNMSDRGCRNHPDIFCYICGKYTLIRARNVIDRLVKKAYIAYFGIHIGDQDKPCAPHCVYQLQDIFTRMGPWKTKWAIIWGTNGVEGSQ